MGKLRVVPIVHYVEWFTLYMSDIYDFTWSMSYEKFVINIKGIKRADVMPLYGLNTLRSKLQ